ncbi:MAG: protein phosphatase CheZ [Nitrospiraceae bacterium]
MRQSSAAAQRTPQQAGDGQDGNVQLYEELGELARFIDTTMRTLSQFSAPVSSTTEQLPQALTHLTDLKLLTEQGTHEVMKQVEAIQDSRGKMTDGLSALTHLLQSHSAPAAQQLRDVMAALGEDDKRLMDIMTALSFQDLVAQRVNKLATIIDEVQHKLLQLVVVFGPYQKQAAAQQGQTKATHMLKQLEAAKTTAMDQDLADEILKEFGFN